MPIYYLALTRMGKLFCLWAAWNILFGSHWKHCFPDNISVLSTLEVLKTMRYINRQFFTYLLMVSNGPHSTKKLNLLNNKLFSCKKLNMFIKLYY